MVQPGLPASFGPVYSTLWLSCREVSGVGETTVAWYNAEMIADTQSPPDAQHTAFSRTPWVYELYLNPHTGQLLKFHNS